MLFYFVIFIVIGFVLGAMQKNVKIASVIIIAISLCWAVVFGAWALAAFVELIFGYALAKYLAKDKEQIEATQSVEQVDKRSDVLIRDEVTRERQKSNGVNAILDKVGSLSVDELKRELQNESQRSCLNEIKALLEMPESLRTPRHFRALTFACANTLGEPICEVPDELAAGFYHALVHESGLNLQHVPDALKTTELCLAAVQDTNMVLEYVPENVKTPEFCLAVVSMHGSALSIVPEALKTRELCLSAVENAKYSSSPLQFVPIRLKTPEMCFVAVQECADALKYVPDRLKTPEFCLTAVKFHGSALEHVPDKIKSPELCLAAIEQSGSALEFVPEKIKTAKFCLAAIQESPSALEYVPDTLKTTELCLAAISDAGHWDNERVFGHIPAYLKTPEFFIAAVKQNGSVLKFISDEFKTADLCKLAVQQSGHALQYVPTALRKPELIIEAVQEDPSTLSLIREEHKTFELCLAAVEMKGAALEYVPDTLKTYELCLAAVQQSGYALEYVPEKLRTPELCLEAIRADSPSFGSALEHVPSKYKTSKLCLKAVQQCGWNLQYVPDKFKAPQLCLAAVQQKGCSLQYVPDKFRTAELCLAAVIENEHAIEHVPGDLQGSVLQLVASQSFDNDSDEDSDEFIAFEFDESEDIVALQDYESLFVSKPLKTYEQCLSAVQKDGWQLERVPPEFITQELCLEAVKQNGWALQFVPDKYKSSEICLVAINEESRAVEYLPEELKKLRTHDLSERVFANINYDFNEYIAEDASSGKREPQPNDHATNQHNSTHAQIQHSNRTAKAVTPLERAIENSGVKYIVHFTQESNIDSIVQYGLVPKDMFSEFAISGACNDSLRLDSREDASCFSIGFPNSLMFYKYRKITEPQGIEWAVFVLNKKVLTDKDCLFCFTNAASSSIRQLNVNDLRGVSAFNRLYTDAEEGPTRKELGLPNDWPTDVQAEVLVKGVVEPRYILGIMFDKEELMAKYKLKYPYLDIRANKFFYNTRDYSLRGT